MFDDQQYPDTHFDDDGSGLIALLGVVLVIAVIVAGIALNVRT